MSCSRTQRNASGEARTRNPSISGQALYHDCAPQLGSILCRYDTCPTQYAPDLRGSILCMQGTQYAPRESILCMEHFVALQCSICCLRFIHIIWWTALFIGTKSRINNTHIRKFSNKWHFCNIIGLNATNKLSWRNLNMSK